jgi:hypothetical protein
LGGAFGDPDAFGDVARAIVRISGDAEEHIRVCKHDLKEELAAIYGTGGDVAPIVPVVTLPAGTTVHSPGVRDDLDAALAKIEAALPGAISASYGSTGDRAFVSDDGRTTFGLVDIPFKGGVDPGQDEARAAQAAVEGLTAVWLFPT